MAEVLIFNLKCGKYKKLPIIEPASNVVWTEYIVT